jgi:hypothetical protein
MPSFMEVVSATPQGVGVTDVAAPHPELASQAADLGEYATLFALRRDLEAVRAGQEPTPGEMVGISSQRRFAVTRPTGTPSSGQGVIRPDVLLKLSRDRFVPRNGTLLYPSPVTLPSPLLRHHARDQATRDLLLVMALAIDLGVAPGDRVSAWLDAGAVFPTPSIGVHPEDWFISTQTALESVADAFRSSAAVERAGSRPGAVPACLRVLHGLLLSMLLESWPADRLISHPTLLVSADGQPDPSSSS